jgi:hypothetical protein
VTTEKGKALRLFPFLSLQPTKPDEFRIDAQALQKSASEAGSEINN